MRIWVILLTACLLSGCGFALRGSADLPFQSVFVDLPDFNPLGAELKRNIRAGTNTKVADRREDAQATLSITNEGRSKQILSINSAGRVREFRLRYVLTYAVTDPAGKTLAAPSQLLLERDFSFNDNVLAKESEEALLYRDMQTDMVQQILRRLAASRRA
jgi:LPS-assembly lipoprotein